jgi:hypothetical protein
MNDNLIPVGGGGCRRNDAPKLASPMKPKMAVEREPALIQTSPQEKNSPKTSRIEPLKLTQNS